MSKILKHYIEEAVKGKVAASPSYMKKEAVREKLQGLIADAVASGEITDQATLEGFLQDINISMTALKMIPFMVWQKLAGVEAPPPPMNLPLKYPKKK
jgi:hypothetical protein